MLLNRKFAFFAALLCAITVPAFAQTSSTARPAPAMERTEHQWQGGGHASTFGAYWMGAELKMIREDMVAKAGIIETNEFFFNQGVLLHYKQDRYPAPGEKGASIATMVSFDKAGKPSISLKRIDGKPAGPADAAEIAQAQKHLAELLAVTARVKR